MKNTKSFSNGNQRCKDQPAVPTSGTFLQGQEDTSWFKGTSSERSTKVRHTEAMMTIEKDPHSFLLIHSKW